MSNSAESIRILFSGDAFLAVQKAFFLRCLPLIEKDTILVGIRTGGDVLADRLAVMAESELGFKPETGYLDISLYRDDFAHRSHWPAVEETLIQVSLDGRDVLLIDEVLFTGRTIRAAMDALLDLGRPSTIRLAVLFDRGKRELPIQPDVIGETIQVDRSNSLLVEFGPATQEERAISFVKVDKA